MTNKKPGRETMDFDQLLHHIGHFGTYQKIRILLLMLGPICGGIAVTSFIFTGYVPRHRCVISECENVSTTSYYDRETQPFEKWNEAELTYFPFVESAICKMNPNLSVDCSNVGKTCQRIKLPETSSFLSSSNSKPLISEACENLQLQMNDTLENGNDDWTIENITQRCSFDELVYDKSLITSSFSIQHNFVCDRKFLKGIFNALYMVGMLFGALVLGIIADNWGRRSAFFISVLLVASSGVISPFISSTAFFAILRIVEGMGGMGCFLIPYVMIAESTLPKFVLTFNVIVSTGWPIGELILALEAYLLRDHVILQLVSHAPMFFVIVVIFIGIPESTRWLISKKMYDQASKQVFKIAKINGTTAPKDMCDPNTMTKKVALEVCIDNDPTIEELQSSRPTFIDLFWPYSMLFRTLNLFLQWFSVTMTFYGLTFASATLQLAGNVYLNFTLNVLVEFIASLIAYLLVDKLGRRPCMVGTQFVSGVCVLICGNMVNLPKSLSKQVLQTFFYLFGKLLAGLCFGMCYLYTSELYPTPLRGTAVGCCSTMARVGGIIALCIAPLGYIWKPLPMTVMGSVAIIAGIFAMAFPETTGRKLPETMTEAMNIGKVSPYELRSTSLGQNNKAYHE